MRDAVLMRMTATSAPSRAKAAWRRPAATGVRPDGPDASGGSSRAWTRRRRSEGRVSGWVIAPGAERALTGYSSCGDVGVEVGAAVSVGGTGIDGYSGYGYSGYGYSGYGYSGYGIRAAGIRAAASGLRAFGLRHSGCGIRAAGIRAAAFGFRFGLWAGARGGRRGRQKSGGFCPL